MYAGKLVLELKPGAFYIMDRGYVDFTRLYASRALRPFFVTRAKSNSLYTFLQVLTLTLFERAPIIRSLMDSDYN